MRIRFDKVRLTPISLLFLFALDSVFSIDAPFPFDPTQEENVLGVQVCKMYADGKKESWAFGSRDIKSALPMEENTTQLIYSMTKAITAIAILQLIEKGKLNLETIVQHELQEIPYKEPIALAYLLSQSSGIPNPIPLRWAHLPEEDGNFKEREKWIQRLSENPELDFFPGKRYAYSNLSYWTLGFLIEKASGLSYREYITKNVLAPLKLTEKELGFKFTSNHSKGYLQKWSFLNLFKSFLIDSKFIGEAESSYVEIKPHHVDGKATGGLIGTACGFATVFADLLKDLPKLLKPKTRDLLFSHALDSKSNSLSMTYGFHIRESKGKILYFKEGGGAGFHGEVQIPESKEFVIVVIGNDTSFPAGKVAENWQ